MAKKKPVEVSEDELDDLLDDESSEESEEEASEESEEETSEESEEETSDEDLDDLLGDDETSDEGGDDAPEEEEKEDKKSSKKKAASKKKSAKKEEKEDKPKRIEGLTKVTEESGVITFNEGSGSQGLLLLIRKVGFDKAKIVKFLDTEKGKKFSAKYFSKCDPEKKYAKVAGIIKKLQKEGYKLNAE